MEDGVEEPLVVDYLGLEGHGQQVLLGEFDCDADVGLVFLGDDSTATLFDQLGHLAHVRVRDLVVSHVLEDVYLTTC